MLLNWTVFGIKTFGQDRISPPTRYISGTDTFTVFTIASERIIAYRLAEYENCKKEVVMADSVIAGADSLIVVKDELISTLELQKENLRQISSIQNGVILTYKEEVTLNKKEIKKLHRSVLLWKFISLGVSSLSVYLIATK
jgi:hypothetical protein